MAEFRLDEDQKQIQDMMRKFALEELRKMARECDESASRPMKFWISLIRTSFPPLFHDALPLSRHD